MFLDFPKQPSCVKLQRQMHSSQCRIRMKWSTHCAERSDPRIHFYEHIYTLKKRARLAQIRYEKKYEKNLNNLKNINGETFFEKPVRLGEVLRSFFPTRI